jgi:hypothetical protein
MWRPSRKAFASGAVACAANPSLITPPPPPPRRPTASHPPPSQRAPAPSDTAPDAPELGRRDNRWMTTSYYMHYCPLGRRSPRGIATRLSPLPLPLALPALSATAYTMEYTAEYTRRAHSQSSATDTRPCSSVGLSDVPNLLVVPAVTGTSIGQYPTALVIATYRPTMRIYVASPPAIAGALTHPLNRSPTSPHHFNSARFCQTINPLNPNHNV